MRIHWKSLIAIPKLRKRVMRWSGVKIFWFLSGANKGWGINVCQKKTQFKGKVDKSFSVFSQVHDFGLASFNLDAYHSIHLQTGGPLTTFFNVPVTF